MREPRGRQAATNYLERNRTDQTFHAANHAYPRLHVVLDGATVLDAGTDPEHAARVAAANTGTRHVEYVAVTVHQPATSPTPASVDGCPPSQKDGSSKTSSAPSAPPEGTP